MLLFGRARSRLRLLCPRSVRRLRPAVSRVTGPTFPACICLPPFPLLFRIQRRGRPQLPARRNGCKLDAKWVHVRLNHLHVFMPKPPPRTEQPSMADFALPCGEARKLLGNCADGRLGAFCLSSLQSLELRRAIFPSLSLRGAWRGASRWRQSGGGGDR